jgi:anti-sigma factor RsiW
MTNDPLYNPLREESWRRKLTPAEAAELHAWLEAHPEARADWEADAALTQALDRLPDAPVASNFTARVLQTVEGEAAAEVRRSQASWLHWSWRLRWLPKVAVGAVILVSGLVSYHSVQRAHRVEMVRSVAAVAEVPGPEILENFEAIRALSPAPPADEELLALLK